MAFKELMSIINDVEPELLGKNYFQIEQIVRCKNPQKAPNPGFTLMRNCGRACVKVNSSFADEAGVFKKIYNVKGRKEEQYYGNMNFLYNIFNKTLPKAKLEHVPDGIRQFNDSVGNDLYIIDWERSGVPENKKVRIYPKIRHMTELKAAGIAQRIKTMEETDEDLITLKPILSSLETIRLKDAVSIKDWILNNSRVKFKQYMYRTTNEEMREYSGIGSCFGSKVPVLTRYPVRIDDHEIEIGIDLLFGHLLGTANRLLPLDSKYKDARQELSEYLVEKTKRPIEDYLVGMYEDIPKGYHFWVHNGYSGTTTNQFYHLGKLVKIQRSNHEMFEGTVEIGPYKIKAKIFKDNDEESIIVYNRDCEKNIFVLNKLISCAIRLVSRSNINNIQFGRHVPSRGWFEGDFKMGHYDGVRPGRVVDIDLMEVQTVITGEGWTNQRISPMKPFIPGPEPKGIIKKERDGMRKALTLFNNVGLNNATLRLIQAGLDQPIEDLFGDYVVTNKKAEEMARHVARRMASKENLKPEPGVIMFCSLALKSSGEAVSHGRVNIEVRDGMKSTKLEMTNYSQLLTNFSEGKLVKDQGFMIDEPTKDLHDGSFRTIMHEYQMEKRMLEGVYFNRGDRQPERSRPWMDASDDEEDDVPIEGEDFGETLQEINFTDIPSIATEINRKRKSNAERVEDFIKKVRQDMPFGSKTYKPLFE